LKLRPVEAEILIKALVRIGFQPVRQRGSLLILKHHDGKEYSNPCAPWKRARTGNIDGDNERCGAEQERVFLELLER
jgi:predicted RNA binding protein YcfA (HicA-like mRNA interferase family)